MSVSQTDRAARLIEEAEDLLKQAREILHGAPAVATPTDLGSRVLAEILKRGGSVSRPQLYEIAAKVGMDRRGLGGLFRQTGTPYLHVLRGDRVVLTPHGAEQADSYIERSRVAEYPATDETVAFSRVAEGSFAEDWDSDEDAAYDDL